MTTETNRDKALHEASKPSHPIGMTLNDDLHSPAKAITYALLDIAHAIREQTQATTTALTQEKQ